MSRLIFVIFFFPILLFSQSDSTLVEHFIFNSLSSLDSMGVLLSVIKVVVYVVVSFMPSFQPIYS